MFDRQGLRFLTFPGLVGYLLVFNAVLVLCVVAAQATWVLGPLRMLASAVLTLVLPGAAWLGLFRKRPLDVPRLALAVVGLSSLASLGGVGAMALAAGGPSRPLLLLWTFLVVNLGLLVAGRPARLQPGRPWRLLGVIVLAGFLLTSTAALHLVPPLEDHDMEVRGTAYGLTASFKPYFLTNREIHLPFAHPLLFHVHVAQSLVFTGEIDATRPSYDSALRAEEARRRGSAFPWMGAWQADYRSFLDRPALAGTRAPSALFAALVLALLADLVSSLAGHWGAGAAAACLYASFPETVVRSAYAGYFSVTVFAMLAAAMLFDERDDRDDQNAHDAQDAREVHEGREARARAGGVSRSPLSGVGLRGAHPDAPSDRRALARRSVSSAVLHPLGWIAAAGALAALVDHKTVVLVLGVCGLALLRALLDLWPNLRLARGSRRSGALRVDSARGRHARPDPIPEGDTASSVSSAGTSSAAGPRSLPARKPQSESTVNVHDVREASPGPGAVRRGWGLASWWPAVDKRVVALAAGFAAGSGLWWGYGLAIDSATFVRDHVRMHILHRFLLNDIRLVHDTGRYAPSMTELWTEFAAHTGYVFLPVAALGIAIWLFTRGADDRRAVLAAWCVTGAILFTLTDWRQTKHLMNGLAPMVAAAVCLAWPSRRGNAARAASTTDSTSAGRETIPVSVTRDSFLGAAERRAVSAQPAADEGQPRPVSGADGTLRRVSGVAALRTHSPREAGQVTQRARWQAFPPWRVALLFLLAAALVINLLTDARLVRDFRSLRVSGASDVDGW